MTDKELKDMDETTSMDTTAAAGVRGRDGDSERGGGRCAAVRCGRAAVRCGFRRDDQCRYDVRTGTGGRRRGRRGRERRPRQRHAQSGPHRGNRPMTIHPPITSKPRVPPRPPRPSPPTSTVRSRSATRISTCLRAYPTLSLHDVTYRDRKTGRTPVEHLTCAFEAGTVSAILVPDGDDMARTAMVGLLSGLLMPESGHLMNRSAELPQHRTARTARTPHRPGAAAVRGARRPLAGAEPRVRHGRLQPQLPQAQARVGPANCCWRPDWTKRCWTTASIP